MNPIASISHGIPLYASPVLANFNVFFTDKNITTGTAIVQIKAKISPKLSTANGLANITIGRTTRRLCVSQLLFFKIPFVNASTRPAAINPNVVSRKRFDWKEASRMVFPKMLPPAQNSLTAASKIQNPHAIAVSQKSSPYSALISDVNICFAAKSPTINVIIHSPVPTSMPSWENPNKKALAQTDPVPIKTQSFTLHDGTTGSNKFFRNSANTADKITKIPAANASFKPAENNTIPSANASAGYFNFI